MKLISFLIALTCPLSLCAQDKTLPYYEIPSHSESFTAGTVAARVIDGLGFRFFWATEGLRAEDLAFKPNPDARTSEETIAHIYEMSILILNATSNTPNVPGQDKNLPYLEMRKTTIQNLKSASDRLRLCSDTQMKDLKVIFKENNQSVEFPFWNLINGPIEDCIWHTGQVVSFRRSSGNPFQEKVDLFTGTLSK
jgi:hypothetical protein